MALAKLGPHKLVQLVCLLWFPGPPGRARLAACGLPCAGGATRSGAGDADVGSVCL